MIINMMLIGAGIWSGLMGWGFGLQKKFTQLEGLPPVPVYQVRKVKEKITIDGRLNEKAWSQAEPITLMFPWDSQKGIKQKTTVRLLWDRENLYVAYECVDQDITARHENHDDPVYEDDCVEIFIKPNADLNLYYGLEMNARGVLYDYFFKFPEEAKKEFDLEGVQLKTELRGTLNKRQDKDQGWTLELAIPLKNFSELAPSVPIKAGDEWHVQINRWDGTEDVGRRLSMWTHSGLKDTNPHNPERFGRLVFSQ